MRKLVLLIIILISVSMIVSFSLGSCAPTVPVEEVTEAAAEETAAAAEPVEGPEEVDLVVSIPTQSSEWWVIYADMVRQSVDVINAEGRYNINLTLIHSDETIDQFNAVSDLIVDEPDVLLLAPIDMEVSIQTVDAAHTLEIPVVTMVRTSNSENVDAAILYYEPWFGEVQAEKIAELFPDGGNLVYIFGPREASYAIDAVFNGFLPTLEKYPKIKMLHMYEDKQDTQDVGLKIAEDALVTYDNIDCLSGTSDDLVLGAIQAAKAAGRFDEITFVGAGTLPQSMVSMYEDELQFTIMKSQAKIALEAVRLTLKVYSGEEYEKVTLLEGEVIDKENFMTFRDPMFGGTLSEPATFDFSQIE